MVVAVCLLIGSALLLLVAPWLLTVGRWQVRHPRSALASWFAAFFAGIGMAAGSVIASIGVGVSAAALSDPAEAVAATVVSWLTLGALGAAIAFIAMTAEPLAISRREQQRLLAPVAVSREDRRDVVLVWFEDDAPVACAVPGANPEILVSTGLRDLLTQARLQAVIAHEYAHLRYRHGWAVGIAEVNALCVPRFLRAGVGLRRATLLLVELVADDAAARQVGAAHLANALARMARVVDDPGLELRAERLTLRRWPSARRRRIPEPIRL